MKTQETAAPLLPKDILIVEDSATHAAVLKIALEEQGWRVRIAGDGVEALEMIRLDKPAIVVSDIRMPNMDGYALSRTIKTDPALHDVPVVLLTSLSQSRDIIDAINSRADYYLLKQWSHDVLIFKIAAVLDSHQPLYGPGRDGLAVRFDGDSYTIEADARQPLHLLLCTYEIAVQQSLELARSRDELRETRDQFEALVTERTAALHASELRYRRLFESAKDGILILDAETGFVVDVNPFLVDLLGFSHEQCLGKTIWELGFLKDIIANKAQFLELQQKKYVRYEHLPLETKAGQPLDVEVVSNVYLAGDKKVIQCNIRDISERVVRERQQKLAMQVLATLNRGSEVALLVKDILHLIKESTGLEAVGIRLRESDDFPYFETNGFPEHFIEFERHLCARSQTGELIRDANGDAVLECMCGNVLRGRTDPARPFFTGRGSFWSNNTTELLATTTEGDRQAHTRNRCNGEGYESVALIPLRSGDEVIGLLQLNDHRKGMFTLEMVHFFEEMGASIGIAVARKRAADELGAAANFPSEDRRPVLRIAGDGTLLYANAAALTRLGDWQLQTGQPGPAKLRELVSLAVGCGLPQEAEIGHDDRLYRFSVTPVAGSAYANLYGTDITERKMAERDIREANTLLEAVVENIPLMLFLKEASDLRFVIFNRAGEELLGYDRKVLLGKNNLDLFPPEQAAHFMAKDREALLGEGVVDIPEEPILTARKGERLLHTRKVCIRGVDGKTKFLLGISEDITERKRAEERIQHLNRVLRAIRAVNQLSVRERDPQTLVQEACRILVEHRSYLCAMIVLTDDKGNPRIYAQAGMRDTFQPMADRLDQGFLPPCCGSAKANAGDGVHLVTGRAAVCAACTLGDYCANTDTMLLPLRHKEEVLGFLMVAVEHAIATDLEEQSLFCEAASDIAFAVHGIGLEAERRELEKQLAQARKMESVGRLAGGVAHDFNNMLMGIMNYAELCRDKIEPDHPIREWLNEITVDAERSTKLTQQLLAFARKQLIAPEALELNAAIESMLKLLRRLIGEDVTITWRPGPDTWQVKMDPVQIDQILANLAVNARDAIGGVGSIAIDASNATLDASYCADHPDSLPGNYVVLSVSDDGCGMDKETLANIFEPFFTTKGEGEGTGLGLATVYGIVKQNNGFINVYSEPGKGTTFRIHLPRLVVSEAAPGAVGGPKPLPRGNETVLVVEDEKSIRITVSMFLEDLGYTVLVAEAPEQALRLVAAHPGEIHLLITDVIMPGMSGRDLADRLLELRPAIKRLFISGFTADVIAQRGILDEGVNFLSKPFGRDALARKVREVLAA